MINSAGLSKAEKLAADVESRHSKGAFHWAASSWAVREEFLAGTNQASYKYHVVIIKNTVHDPGTAIELSMADIQEYLSKIYHIIDGDKGRGFEHRFKMLLRGRSVYTRKLRTANDEGFAGLRLADAIAGLHRYLAEKPDHPQVSKLAKIIVKYRLK
jgi:hypothetical protein